MTQHNNMRKHGQHGTGNYLTVVGSVDRNLHLSPILRHIRDDGPALLDGEVLQAAPAPLPVPKPKPKIADPLAAVAVAATTEIPAALAALPVPLWRQRPLVLLAAAALLLAMALAGSGLLLWQQEQRLQALENRLLPIQQ